LRPGRLNLTFRELWCPFPKIIIHNWSTRPQWHALRGVLWYFFRHILRILLKFN
jgi:hypothetical protein